MDECQTLLAGLTSTEQIIEMDYGVSSRLYLPIAYNLSSGVTLKPVTTYAALKETKMSPLVALILDGGLNYVKDAARNVTVVANRGDMSYTLRNSSLGRAVR